MLLYWKVVWDKNFCHLLQAAPMYLYQTFYLMATEMLMATMFLLSQSVIWPIDKGKTTLHGMIPSLWAQVLQHFAAKGQLKSFKEHQQFILGFSCHETNLKHIGNEDTQIHQHNPPCGQATEAKISKCQGQNGCKGTQHGSTISCCATQKAHHQKDVDEDASICSNEKQDALEDLEG